MTALTGLALLVAASSAAQSPPPAGVRDRGVGIDAVFAWVRFTEFDPAREFVRRTVPTASVPPATWLEPGVGGRVIYRLDAVLAIEADVTWYPKYRGSAGVLLYRGSNKVQMLAGVTAGARRGKLRISGKIKPGAMRFARLPEIFFLNGDSNAFAIGVVNRRPATCLTVDFGVAAEWRLSRRLVARADAGATIVSYHPRPRELNPWFTRHDVSFLIGPGLRF